MKIPDINSLRAAQFREIHIMKHYPEFYNYLITFYKDKPENFSEKLCWYYHNLSDYPRCPICGAIPSFVNVREGYRKYCSSKCLNADPEKKEKSKQTNIKRYGGPAPYCSDAIRAKGKQTNIERYGFENPMQNEDIKNKSFNTTRERYKGIGNQSLHIKKKQQQTCLDRYGVECIFQSKEFTDGIKQTIKDKYGVPNPRCIGVEKLRETKLKQSQQKYPDIIGSQEGMWICKCPHPSCTQCQEKTYLTPRNIHRDRVKDGTELCTKLFPINNPSRPSSLEIRVRTFLDSLGLEYQTNVRDIIPPKELDIYIPSKKIAIEINGCYWHSDQEKPKNYHMDKYKDCEAHGIQLIQIWEDWLINKPDIIQSILLSKLGECHNVIYARQCELREVTPKDTRIFLEENHIQGPCNSKYSYGLYYDNELVSLMTFGAQRKNLKGNLNEGEYELLRFCNKLDIRVVGGASRLLKHFIKLVKPLNIVSFASCDISNGNLYNALGFETDGNITQSYWYIDPEDFQRYHRSSFTKASIVKRGWKASVDSSWTERDVMDAVGFIRIYDAGQTKWTKKL